MTTTFQGFLGEGAINRSTPLVYASSTSSVGVISEHTCNVTLLTALNTTANNRYFQLFEKRLFPASLVDRAVWQVYVPAFAQVSWAPSLGGRVFDTGLAFGVSSTIDLYTAATLDIFYVVVEGETL